MNIGYTDEQIELIINSYPLNTYTESTLLFNIKNMINFFHRNGLNNEDIIKITSTIPNLLVISTENIKNELPLNKTCVTLGVTCAKIHPTCATKEKLVQQII